MTQDSTQANKEGSPATVAQPWGDHERPTPLRSKPWILDAFCGAGGASMGYHRAGFDVIGVDIKPQPNYPFAFVQADAIDFLRELISIGPAAMQYDAIHASPPCQRWSQKTYTASPLSHPDLITPTRELLEASGLRYVIENVPLAPLEGPIICGSSFHLGVRRHRRFETNWPLMVPPCAHGLQPPRFELYDHGKSYLSGIVHVFGAGSGKGREFWSEAMGIDWMTDEELCDAIPPTYTELIGEQLMGFVRRSWQAGDPVPHEGGLPGEIELLEREWE